MKKIFWYMFVAMSALLLPLNCVSANPMPQEPRGAGVAAPDFVMSEFADKPVKGAPYSAQAVTESRQKLVDGNEIVNKSEATVYRDSQGRTRREQDLKTIGGLTGAPPVQFISISDPVAGTSYTLDPRTKTARKGAFFSLFVGGGNAAGGAGAINSISTGAVVFSRNESSNGGGGYTLSASPESAPAAANADRDRVTLLRQALENVKREDLGTQTIEGVEATGTRSTVTIAAGEIGNEKPIEVVTERWYSKELQTTVMSRHSDPRTGETTFRLININRNEPAASLFEVPSDYKITDAGNVYYRTKD